LQLENYHEQAQLLDPHVGPIVDKLTAVIRREALSQSEANWNALRQASTFLWALVTVRCLQHPVTLLRNAHDKVICLSRMPPYIAMIVAYSSTSIASGETCKWLESLQGVQGSCQELLNRSGRSGTSDGSPLPQTGKPG